MHPIEDVFAHAGKPKTLKCVTIGFFPLQMLVTPNEISPLDSPVDSTDLVPTTDASDSV